jgi:hypothetical protein
MAGIRGWASVGSLAMANLVRNPCPQHTLVRDEPFYI